MVNKSEFFSYTNHFARTAHIPSIQIFESSLDCVSKVTIAIPTYKRADLLKEALDSALNQTDYDDYDVLVVDNNPDRNDETEKLLLTYNNPRLSYYKNTKNLGMTGNWNRLYEIAKGEWVVMLHDDDLLNEKYLSYLFNIIIKKFEDKYSIYAVSFNSLNLISNNGVFGEYNTRGKIAIERIQYKDFCHGNIIGPPLGLCIRKKDMIKIGGFNDTYYPVIDYEFYIKASFYAKMVKVTGIPLCTYRIQENESLKIETVKGLVIKMIEILNILNRDKSLWVRYLWNSYSEVLGYYLLQACKKEYKLKEEVIDELKADLLIKVNIFSFVVYRLFSFNYRLKKKVYTFIDRNYR